MLGGREVHRLGTCITTSLLARRYLTYWQMQTSLNHTSEFAFRLFRPAESFTSYCLSYIDIDSSFFLPFFPFSSVILIYIHSAHPTRRANPEPTREDVPPHHHHLLLLLIPPRTHTRIFSSSRTSLLLRRSSARCSIPRPDSPWGANSRSAGESAERLDGRTFSCSESYAVGRAADGTVEFL